MSYAVIRMSFQTIYSINYVLTYVYSEHFTGKVYIWLCYITLYNANSLKIPLMQQCKFC
jgi:hypothetical protein